jgi:DNA polymerase-3 subunit alpha
MQMLTYEKEALGFYVTSNPLSKHADVIRLYSTANTSQLGSRKEGQDVIVGGMVGKVRTMITRQGPRSGQKMAVFELEDLQGKCDAVLFSKVLEQYGHLLEVDRILFVKGRVDFRRESPNLICDELISLEDVAGRLSVSVLIKLSSYDVNEQMVERIRSLCSSCRGKSPVHLSIQTPGGYRILAAADKSFSVRPEVDFCRKLEGVVGAGRVELRGISR